MGHKVGTISMKRSTPPAAEVVISSRMSPDHDVYALFGVRRFQSRSELAKYKKGKIVPLQAQRVPAGLGSQIFMILGI